MEATPLRRERLNARTLQACQRCRSLKTRCLPSPMEGVCQRCSKSRQDCVWAELQPKIRKRRGPSRIWQVEQKIDHLVSHINDKNTAEQRQSTDSSTSREPNRVHGKKPQYYNSPESTPGQQIGGDGEEDDSAFSLHELAQVHDFDSVLDDPQSKTKPDAASGALMKLLAGAEVESLLEEYRTISWSLPFVPINSETTVQSLRAQKPMLLLAIMTVSSWRNRKLQLSIEKQYRNELMQRILIQPRKDVALLQSVLVYLSWYHYFFDQKVHTPTTILHIAVALVADLKLEQKPDVHSFPQRRHKVKSASEEREEQRTLLGCYFICSTIANEFQISGLLRYSDYMSEYGNRLEADNEYESDKILQTLISACQIEDQISDRDSTSRFNRSQASNQRIEFQMRQLKARVEELKHNYENEELHRILNFLRHTMVMKFSDESSRCSPEESYVDQPPALGESSSNRSVHMMSCLDAGKRFLDDLVAIPVEDYHSLTFAEWMRLPRLVMTMTKVSMPNESNPSEWNLKAAQDRLRLDLYLESLCFRMQNLTTFKPPSQPQPDFWMVMKMVMQSVRNWYKRKVGPWSHKYPSKNSVRMKKPQPKTALTATPPVEEASSARMSSNTPWSGTAMDLTPFETPEHFAESFMMICPMVNLDTEAVLDVDDFDASFWGGQSGLFDPMDPMQVSKPGD